MDLAEGLRPCDLGREGGLTFEHAGITYFFCGKGCKLDFADDPATYLDPSYSQTM